MIKKTVTYQDLDGNDVTEDFYFNFTKAELAEMALSEKGGLAEKFKAMIASEDQKEIMATFKWLLGLSVGRRSEDGKRFMKSQTITDEFMQSDAYSVVFMELLTDSGAAAAFVRGMVPSEYAAQVNDDGSLKPQIKQLTKEANIHEILPGPIEDRPKEITDYTFEQLKDMSYSEFEQLVSHDISNLPKQILVLAMQRKNKGE